MEQELHPNAGKNDIIEVDGVRYQRLPIKTHLITDKDNILDVAEKYGKPVLSKPGDVLFISEKCVACTQRRAIPLADIKPRKLAYKLSAHVTKTPHGIGLGMPETMEMALREVGSLRILFAAAISVIGKKIFRKKGWFYAVAGYRARSIDGPCHNTIPPYNHYVVLGPLKPDQVAKDIAARVGYDVAIVDINDLEGQILGASSKAVNKKLYARILKDNPLGQDDQQTRLHEKQLRHIDCVGAEIMRAEGIGMDFSRERAQAYAHRWAFGRNPEYLAFDRLGGDCTSFVSQCLLAGGAPEDPTPLWGWYYRSGNDKAPAWSGVEPFWRFFTRSDREDGLRGVECGPEDLQPGDVIQLSFDGRRYAHCLLVVGTGRQILVCAHDEDSDFRPLSTYERQKTRFLHWMLPFSSALPSASGE